MIFCAAGARAPPRARRTARAPTCRCRRGRRATRCRSRGRAAGRSRSAARRERPCRPKTSRSPRTRRTALSPVTRPSAEPRSEWMTRPVCTGRSLRAARSTALALVQPVDLARSETSSSAMPVHVGVDGLLGAVLLGGEADGGGLDPQRQVLGDDVTSRPSLARFSATARMRESLCRLRSPDGSTGRSAWLSSTRSEPPGRRRRSGSRGARARMRSSSRMRRACRAK